MAYVIGIAGGSGSGKSTFLKQLKANLDEDCFTMVTQDDYYHPREHQITDENGIKNFDLPTSIDSDLLLTHLQQLRQGHSVSKQEYTFNNDKVIPTVKTLNPSPVIIVEGLFIYHFVEVAKLCDLKLFIDAPTDLKIIRRIKRDQDERNYPLDDVLYRYQHHVVPSYTDYIAPYRDDCDLIINNKSKMNEAVRVVSTFINSIG